MNIDWAYFAPVLLCGAVAGGSTGLLGVYIVGMRIPFLGVCVSHAALAGAVFGSLFGLSGQWLLAPAMAGAVATALLLGLCDPRRMQGQANVLMGILFSLSMGLAFLGIGLFTRFGRSDSEALGLLWGSLTFCGWGDLAIMTTTAGLLGLFVWAMKKEMRAIMFSRHQAAAAGIAVGLVWIAFLVLTSAVLTVNFQTVGGLMIYSLMTNPAAAAFLLTKGHGKTVALAVALGTLCGTGGFLISLFISGVTTGAAIVILSSALVAVAAIIKWLRHRSLK